MDTIHQTPVTHPSATPDRDCSALAVFFAGAGWVPSDLDLFEGDPLFRAGVAGVMAVLEASGQ